MQVPPAPPRPAPSAQAQVTGQACADFGVQLYLETSKTAKDQNLCVSPWSAYAALAMLSEGAKGKTKDEFARVLRAKTDADGRLLPLHQGVQAIAGDLVTGAGAAGERAQAIEAELEGLERKLAGLKGKIHLFADSADRMADIQAEEPVVTRINQLRQELNHYELRSTCALFGEKTCPFVPAFQKNADTYYGTGNIQNLDFKNTPEDARKTVNAWGAKQTHDKITEVLPANSVDKDTRMVLANAVYFLGEWNKPFEKHATQNAPFHGADGKDTQVPLMSRWDTLNYAAIQTDGSLFTIPKEVPADHDEQGYPSQGFHLIELPYKGEQLSMVLLAPVEGRELAPLETLLTPKRMSAWLGALSPWGATVQLPRFRIAGASMNLTDTLKAMGLQEAFKDRQADFTGLSDVVKRTGNSDDNLYLSGAYQQTFIEVNEKGTEAAAVTALPMMRCASAPMRVKTVPFHPVFRADHPFLFLLRDRRSGAILFMGRVMRPEQ